MELEFIFMLTHGDRTVENAVDFLADHAVSRLRFQAKESQQFAEESLKRRASRVAVHLRGE